MRFGFTEICVIVTSPKKATDSWTVVESKVVRHDALCGVGDVPFKM